MALDQFTFDPETRLHVHPAVRSIAYSDGKEVEQRLYQILRKAQDRSSASEELQRQITDWPTEYHFSPTRHNLLRHLPIGPDANVLELGAGCGAITRQLGETGAAVTAVEGTIARARCAALRCADLSNVQVYCGNFQSLPFERTYDYVTLTGVLEYAPMFFDASDPADAMATCLQLAQRLLKPWGTLVLAIENRVGLKYLFGQSEDHTGRPYDGVQDLYNSRTARTLGRRELEAALRAAGFESIVFQYPFPDYKLPRVILTERAFDCERFRPAELLTNCASRDYSRGLEPPCDEQLVWRTLDANGLTRDLANSFLVLAGTQPGHEQEPDGLLAVRYSVGRKSAYTIETRFHQMSDGHIHVSKQRLHLMQPHSATIQHTPADSHYKPGESLTRALVRARAMDDTEQFYALCRRWIEYVQTHAVTQEDRAEWRAQIRPEFIDCVPDNVLIDGAQTHDIDREWRLLVPCTLEMLVARGIMCVVLNNWRWLRRGRTSRRRVWQELLNDLGAPATTPLLRKVVELEYLIQRDIAQDSQSSAGELWAFICRPDGVADGELSIVRRSLRAARRRLRSLCHRV